MKNIRPILYKQKMLILTTVDVICLWLYSVFKIHFFKVLLYFLKFYFSSIFLSSNTHKNPKVFILMS